MTISSKLPDVNTSIFAVMSALASEHDAIGLSQGFPDFDTPPALIDRVASHMREGRNQYAPTKRRETGVPLHENAQLSHHRLGNRLLRGTAVNILS